MNGLAGFRLETRISHLHCYSVGPEGFGHTCCRELAEDGVSDGASLGRQAAKVLPMCPGREKTLKVGNRKEGKRMFIFDVKI